MRSVTLWQARWSNTFKTPQTENIEGYGPKGVGEQLTPSFLSDIHRNVTSVVCIRGCFEKCSFLLGKNDLR